MIKRRKTVLVADFFGTVKIRGIAAYVQDVQAILRDHSSVRLLQAPRWVATLPHPVQNLLLVLHEQFYVPFAALILRPDIIIFPYNTSSLLLSLSNRTVMVIHDLIPYRRPRGPLNLALAYLICTAGWHALLGRRIVAISPHTRRVLGAVRPFNRAPITYVPNCFTSLQARERGSLKTEPRRVTLVSGSGKNKAFDETLMLMDAASRRPALADIVFDVVGFGRGSQHAKTIIEQHRARTGSSVNAVVHGLLSRTELDAMLSSAGATWVHSLAEGFGRVVVEGRMAGGPVVMSRLPVFRALSDPWTFAYSNDRQEEFCDCLERAMALGPGICPYVIIDQLQADARAGLKELLAP